MSYIKNFLLSSQLFGARLKYMKCWGPEFKLGDLNFPYTVLQQKKTEFSFKFQEIKSSVFFLVWIQPEKFLRRFPHQAYELHAVSSM